MNDGWEDGPSPVDDNVYALARMVESEAGGTPEVARRAVAHAALNHAGGKAISEVLGKSKSGSGAFGRQDEGRYASTSKLPSQESIRIAQDAISGASQDPTGGADQWDSPQAYPDPARADVIAQRRAKEGKSITTLDGVPSSVFRFYRKGDAKSAPNDDGWVDGPAGNQTPPAKAEPAYALTDYGGRENKLGPMTDAVQNQGPGDVDLGDSRAARAEANGLTPDQQLRHDYAPDANPTPDEAARGFLGIAGGAAAGMLAGQIPKVAAMAETGGLGARMGSGAIQGAATSAATADPNADRNHQVMNLLLGAGLGAAGQRSPRESAYVPGSQGALDDATYAARGAEPSILPGGMRQMEPAPAAPPRGQGSIGTEQAARELESLIHGQVEARSKANGEFIGQDQQAMAQAWHQQNPGGSIDTDPALAAIAKIRQQQMGPHQSFLPEQDARLAEAQKNLLRDPADVMSSEMSPEELQKLWHAMNFRVSNAQPGDMGTAGERQAAGVVADTIKGADPRLGPGNLEGTAQAYGKEKDALSKLSDLTWRSDNGMPADRVGQQTTGISRLGQAGATKETSEVGQQAEQQNLREIERLEPATSPLMSEIRARRTQERREIGLRGGVGVAGTIARSTIGNANNALFRGQGGGVPGSTPDQLILTIEELRKYNELRRKLQEEGHHQ